MAIPISTPPVGRKADDGKPRWDLLPWAATAQVVDVLTFGARKYEPENWRFVDGWRWRYYRAAVGHVAAWWLGERNDRESGLPHLAHAACCLLFLIELDVDDSGRAQAAPTAVCNHEGIGLPDCPVCDPKIRPARKESRE